MEGREGWREEGALGGERSPASLWAVASRAGPRRMESTARLFCGRARRPCARAAAAEAAAAEMSSWAAATAAAAGAGLKAAAARAVAASPASCEVASARTFLRAEIAVPSGSPEGVGRFELGDALAKRLNCSHHAGAPPQERFQACEGRKRRNKNYSHRAVAMCKEELYARSPFRTRCTGAVGPHVHAL